MEFKYELRHKLLDDSNFKKSYKEDYEFLSTNKIKRRKKSNIDHIKNSTVGIMCLHCFNIHKINYNMNTWITVNNEDAHNISFFNPYIDFTLNRCTFCKEQYPEIALIDINISEAISLFNKKGYITRFCCEGHIWENIDSLNPYIAFLNSKILDYISFLPNTWYLDIEDLKRDNFNTRSRYVIRSDYYNFKEAMIDIYQFASNLPYLNNL